MRKQQHGSTQQRGVRPSPDHMARSYRKALTERGDMTKGQIDRAVKRYKDGLENR